MGTQNERRLKKVAPIVEAVNGFEPTVSRMTEGELRSKTDEFRLRITEATGTQRAHMDAMLKKLRGAVTSDEREQDQVEYDEAKKEYRKVLDEILLNIMPEVFAIVREVAKRTVKMRHFDVQIMGGAVLHQGTIAEMATGEGKTLVATLSVYLNALTGDGVHVITVNDYLARRDREWMGPIYEFLGLSIGAIQHDMAPSDRKAAYACDVTYGTNNEFGFDYLRDNMVIRAEDMVQRGLNYAIVDEVDSILVDEARTPLIISGPAGESTDKYYRIDKIIPRLKKDEDYKVDEKAHTVTLTEDGMKKAEELLGVVNLYEDANNMEWVHHLNQALRAHELYKRDTDYLVKDGKVVIVDEFTGRMMPGRRFSEGLHQALEAKENVKIERENQTLATVTFQNYFRMYNKLAGMTGTAETEAHEFIKIYNLDVIVMPTNKPLHRTNHPDVIYRTEKEKFKAVIDEIESLHREGRPVLVGTISIDKSERLGQMLKRRNIQHHVLNAKYHEKEAEIISRAGEPYAVTIATNMAGRGTDIVLGEGIADKGGLHVLGTERHEARRIDNQLRGRSGRQGDPGSSRFYMTLEDDLMRIFGSDRISTIMNKLGMEEGQDIQHPFITRAIETAQKRVESHNFEIRKHLLEYDNVMNRQRQILYDERRKILEGDNLKEHIQEMIKEVIEDTVPVYVPKEVSAEEWDIKGICEWAKARFGIDVSEEILRSRKDEEAISEFVFSSAGEAYDEKERAMTPGMMRQMERVIMLQVIDSKWKDHLYNMDSLREGIGLRAYGQRDPLIEYQHEGYDMFRAMIERVKEETIEFIFKTRVVHDQAKSVFNIRQQNLMHEEVSGFDKSRMPKEPSGGLEGIPPEALGETRGGPAARRPATVKRESPKVGRNDPCPCGSGKKYKKCCGA
ncbi:MAG: preprotein translocase subunit SecA [Candidatus Omnitrophica bacterium]|nr:preprotein translocase subunit SecA [Candidatus Omnitrophota bacterium]